MCARAVIERFHLIIRLIMSIRPNAMDKKNCIRQLPSPEHPYIAFSHKKLALLAITMFTFCKVD